MKKKKMVQGMLLSLIGANIGSVVVFASEEYGISDLMRDQSSKIADTEVMTVASSFITDVFGFVITLGVYGLIAGQFIQTMIDLLYIALPPVRGLLVSGNGRNKVVDGMGHFFGFDELRDRELAKANQYQAEGRPDLADDWYRLAERSQRLSDESDSRRAKINQDKLNYASKHVKKGIDWKNRCLVSSDLKSLIRQNRVVLSAGSVGAQNGGQSTSLNIKAYFKKRVFSMILIVVFIMMAIASNVFVNTGMNVGLGILKMLGVA